MDSKLFFLISKTIRESQTSIYEFNHPRVMIPRSIQTKMKEKKFPMTNFFFRQERKILSDIDNQSKSGFFHITDVKKVSNFQSTKLVAVKHY